MDEATLLMLEPCSCSSGISSALSRSDTHIPTVASMVWALRTLSTMLQRSELGRSFRAHDFLHFGQFENSSDLASQHWMMHTWQKWCPHSRITGSRNSSKHTAQGVNAAGYQPICQRYKNQYHFASLYDRQRRVPLFSAYILSPADGKRPKPIWMHEPQLSFSRASPEMKPFNTPVDQNVIESQAVLNDYRTSSFTKGHLNPSMHQKTKEDRKATFTLTNIVPQKEGSNSGPWNKLEIEVLNSFNDFCEGPMYVITGAMPYKSGAHWIKNRVSVPEYMWSAYCCPSYKSDLPEHVQHFFPTYAAVGRNDPNSGEEIVPIDVKAKAKMRGYDVRRMPLKNLEGILAQRLAMPISLFDNHCQI